MKDPLQTLLLVRGLPGSGKTTFASGYARQGWCHVEADQFMVDDRGNYRFESLRLPEVHRLCFETAAEGLFAGRNVVVANTFIELWEMANYRHLADYLKVALVIHHCRGTYHSSHNVAPTTMATMRRRFQATPEAGQKCNHWDTPWLYRKLQ